MATSLPNSDVYQNIDGSGLRVAIVASRFNSTICDALVEGAREAAVESKVSAKKIEIIRVPGAFEMPLVLKKIALTRKFDAAVALGTVIRGDTPHFDYVCTEVSRGVMEVMLQTSLPIGFGLLTTENLNQAEERAGGKLGNKGTEAMQAALELWQQMHSIQKKFGLKKD